MATDSPETRSLAAVKRALSSVHDGLKAALDVQLPSPRVKPAGIVTTGIGGSESPARILASQLASTGIAASFRPVSSFATGPASGALLVAFSQGLSPNACLALASAHGFQERWIVTSVGWGDASPERKRRLDRLTAEGAVPVVVPPGEETGMLVRWVGPTVACLVALRLAGRLGAAGCDVSLLREAPNRYEAAGASPIPDDCALVLAGVAEAEAQLHRWRILETLLGRDPAVWDVLQIAHGPLQSFHDERITLLVLERPKAAALVERLSRTLDAERHRLVRWRARSDDALALFDHAASVDASLLATLQARPRDLFAWPGRDRDAPLYDLGDGSER